MTTGCRRKLSKEFILLCRSKERLFKAGAKKNVDDLAKKIQTKGGRLDSGPTDQPWGVRDISLTDPDGFKITIAKLNRA